jgi:2-oxoisovalerate ferredoxin oxidoreductase alpha subunit
MALKKNTRLLLKGNDAVIYGALLAGCDCFFGYPITPASEIAHTAALLFPKLGRTFLQAESEIAAINMVFGATSVGRSAITASSGLGISLKQECVSYMATCEMPGVIVDIMRGGPGLGNIGPEQGDYNQVVKGGGHGNYKCIVLAPNSPQEMCDFTVDAFMLSEKYRTPVYVLSDGVIGQMLESVRLPHPIEKKSETDWALAKNKETRANYITSIFLEHDDLEAVNLRLQKKYAEICGKEQRCETYMCGGAEILLVSYGITSRIARNAVDKMRKSGIKAGLLRPQTLFPFPTDELRKIVKNAKLLVSVELSNGQMIDDIRLAISCAKPVGLCARMGGNLPSEDEITDKCLKFMGEL